MNKKQFFKKLNEAFLEFSMMKVIGRRRALSPVRKCTDVNPLMSAIVINCVHDLKRAGRRCSLCVFRNYEWLLIFKTGRYFYCL